MPSGKRWSWTAKSCVLVLALAGCHYYYETPRPTQFTPANVDMIAVDSIVKYGRGLVYDSVYGAADSQRVDFATGNIGSGDWAIIQPERSEEHTSELQSHSDLVCRLLLEKKKKNKKNS